MSVLCLCLMSSFCLFFEVARAPSHTSAEACLTDWPNAQESSVCKCDFCKNALSHFRIIWGVSLYYCLVVRNVKFES